MQQTFIQEIEKQITSNLRLYNQTKIEIFRKRLQQLKDLKSKILTVMQDCRT